MAAKDRRDKPRRSGRRGRTREGDQYGVARVAEPNVYELVPPRSVVRRLPDLEQVHAMLDAGEVDVAVDELRWLLEGCRSLLEAHKLLGEIALADDDLPLARAHFGYAYGLGREAIPPLGLPGVLPYARPANQAFLEAGKGLAWCLGKLGDFGAAKEVVDGLLRLDPSDPLGLGDLSGLSGDP